MTINQYVCCIYLYVKERYRVCFIIRASVDANESSARCKEFFFVRMRLSCGLSLFRVFI